MFQCKLTFFKGEARGKSNLAVTVVSVMGGQHVGQTFGGNGEAGVAPRPRCTPVPVGEVGTLITIQKKDAVSVLEKEGHQWLLINRLPGPVWRRTVPAVGGRQQTAVGTVGGAVGVGARAVRVAPVAIVTDTSGTARVRIGGGTNGRRGPMTYRRDGLFTPGGVMIRRRHFDWMLGLHLI